MCLAIAFVVLGMGAMTTSAVLTWVKKGHWSMAFGSVPALLSMLREVCQTLSQNL